VLYLFLICHDDRFDPPDSLGPETLAWLRDVERRGARRVGGRLRLANEATVVRLRDGERVIQPGPRTSEPEQVAGFDLLEFDSEDEAIEAAAVHPMAAHGAVEVRRIWPD
jgi:hypothetical protein